MTAPRPLPVLLLLLLAHLGACKAPGTYTPVAADPAGGRIAQGLPRTGTERIGLELLTWYVNDDEALVTTLEELETATSEEPTEFAGLGRNALTLHRLPESDLPALLGGIGGVNAAKSTWCGQVTDWRPLREIRFRRRMITVDGRTSLLDGGSLELAARAWVEPTLEGARMRLELVPRFRADRGRFTSLLRREPPPPLIFETLADTTDLGIGEVLLLTCTSRPAPEPFEPETIPPELDADPTDVPAEDVPAPRRRSIDGALALGHALFAVDGQAPERVVLILTPRIPTGSVPEAIAPNTRLTAENAP